MEDEAKKVILCVLERIKYKADLTPDNPSEEVKKDLKIKKESLEELAKEEKETITAPKITDYQRELKWLNGKQIIFTYQQDGLACNLTGNEFVSVLDKLREMGAIKDFRKIENSSPINYKLLLPKDFNKRYQKIKNELTEDAKLHAKLIRKGLEKIDERQKEKEALKKEIIEEIQGDKDKTKKTTGRPFCIIEAGIGYFKFYKEGKKIKIGGQSTRHFRLLQCLCEPVGVAKTIDSVFEAIRLPRDKQDERLNDDYLAKNRKTELIQYAIKELQKNKDLQGKLKFKFNNTKTTVQLEI